MTSRWCSVSRAGHTEYLHSAAVEQIVNVSDPAKIGIRDEALRIIGAHMRKDEKIKIQYAAKYAGIENAHKKWQGEILGLKATQAVAKKKAYEAEFTKRVNANPAWKAKYGHLLADLENVYSDISPLRFARDYYNETNNVIELIQIANQLNDLASRFKNNGEAGYNEVNDNVLYYMEETFKDYDPAIDQELFAALIAKYLADQDPKTVSPYLKEMLNQHKMDYASLAASVYRDTKVTKLDNVQALLKMKGQEFSDAIKDDIAIRILLDMRSAFSNTITPLG